MVQEAVTYSSIKEIIAGKQEMKCIQLPTLNLNKNRQRQWEIILTFVTAQSPVPTRLDSMSFICNNPHKLLDINAVCGGLFAIFYESVIEDF